MDNVAQHGPVTDVHEAGDHRDLAAVTGVWSAELVCSGDTRMSSDFGFDPGVRLLGS